MSGNTEQNEADALTTSAGNAPSVSSSGIGVITEVVSLPSCSDPQTTMQDRCTDSGQSEFAYDVFSTHIGSSAPSTHPSGAYLGAGTVDYAQAFPIILIQGNSHLAAPPLTAANHAATAVLSGAPSGHESANNSTAVIKAEKSDGEGRDQQGREAGNALAPNGDHTKRSLQQLSAEAFFRCGNQNRACPFWTESAAEFGAHLKSAHSGEDLFLCVHCGSEEMGSDSLLQHLEEHLRLQRQLLYCTDSTCDFHSYSPEEVLGHIVVSHPTVASFSCWLCPADFSSAHGLSAHLKQNLIHVVCCPHCAAKDTDRERILTHILGSHPGKRPMVKINTLFLCQERTLSNWHMKNKESLRPPASACLDSGVTSTSAGRDQGEDNSTDDGRYTERALAATEPSAAGSSFEGAPTSEINRSATESSLFSVENDDYANTSIQMSHTSEISSDRPQEEPDRQMETGECGVEGEQQGTTCSASLVAEGSSTSAFDNKNTLIPCPYCERKPRPWAAVEKEIRAHIKYKPFSCTYCGTASSFQSSSREAVEKHISKDHPDLPVKIKVTKDPKKEERLRALLEKAISMTQKRAVQRSAAGVKRKYIKSAAAFSSTSPGVGNGASGHKKTVEPSTSRGTRDSRVRDLFHRIESEGRVFYSCKVCDYSVDTHSGSDHKRYTRMWTHVRNKHTRRPGKKNQTVKTGCPKDASGSTSTDDPPRLHTKDGFSTITHGVYECKVCGKSISASRDGLTVKQAYNRMWNHVNTQHNPK